MKKLFTILLIISTLLTLCGCGGSGSTEDSVSEDFSGTEVSAPAEQTQQEENSNAEASVENYTTGKQQIELPENAYVNDMGCAGGKIYVSICETVESSGEMYSTDQYSICMLRQDGSLDELLSISGYVSTFMVLEDGSVWYYQPSLDEEGMTNNTLAHVSASGELLGTINSKDINMEILKLHPGKDGGVVISSDCGFLVLNSKAEILESLTVKTGFVYSGTTVLEDGSVVALYCPDMESDEREIIRLNLDSLNMETVGKMPNKADFIRFVGGTTEELWVDAKNLQVYDVKGQQFSEGMNWVDLGIDSDFRGAVTLLDEETVVVPVWQRNAAGVEIYVFPLGYTMQSEDKITLTLAGVNIQEEVRELVIAFNEQSTEYYVEIADYYNGIDDSGTEQLLYELNTGDLPDLIHFSSGINEYALDVMARKGYLKDLDAMLESDPDMSREDFLENVLDALSFDGTLYSVPILYVAEIAVANANIVGDEMGCTLDELKVWTEENQELAVLPGVYSDRLLGYLLEPNISDMINRENGRAELDVTGIEEILEYVKSVSDRATNGGTEFGTYLLENAWVADAGSNWYLADRVGEDFTYIGWPTESGFGGYVTPVREIAIASDTEQAEGCWEFIKFFLSKDYQNSVHAEEIPMTLPLRKDTLSEKENALLSDEDEVEENVYKLMDMIAALDRAYRANSLEGGVVEIVQEEADAYFNGEKTLDAVVSSIESRANIYLAEQG